MKSKEQKLAEAVRRQLKGLTYHDAEQVLMLVQNLLKDKSTMKG